MIRLLLIADLIVRANAAPPLRNQQEQAAQAAQQHDQQAQAGHANDQQTTTPQDDGSKHGYQFTYQKYLEEVVKILESDPKFNEKMRGMNEADIKAGNIADHIHDLDNGVFDRLHKAKLDEIERLREQIQKQIEVDGGSHNIKMPDHIDVEQWDKFGKEDLRKLITKTVQDMETIDIERKKDFKEYEMKKKAEEDHKLAQMDAQERERALKEAEEANKRHNEHEKLKHPGGREQLEEVWEEKDHMDKDSYDPKTFFALHDLNGDGYWNDDELEALFQLELEKMYNETDPDDDPRERMEEMYRMREHVSKQMDKNGDRLISLEEFLHDTEAQADDGKDEGWKDLGQEQVYTDKELEEFEREYAKEQGWGEHAYETSTAAHQQPVQPVVDHNQQPVHDAVPPQQAQAQQVHQAPIEQHPPVQTGQQQPYEQQQPLKVDTPKDPSYGI
ncbi:hypothetical protein WR25_23263 [Diploscapter pachys]|uniref:NUCB1-like N-terminal domain-containing protein n=1 Tax=Diploscapter pachys TaxID=2018661 RepID=A0A2A2J6R4_9BILA|nr:hypothetical protein WR25_23263 [Diploscapter pachys]